MWVTSPLPSTSVERSRYTCPPCPSPQCVAAVPRCGVRAVRGRRCRPATRSRWPSPCRMRGCRRRRRCCARWCSCCPVLLGRLEARHLTRGVVAVAYHLPVGIGHGTHAVVTIVLPLRDIGDDGLVRYDQHTHGLQDFTHLRNSSSVELFFPNIITTYISNSIYFKLITIN